MITQTATIKDGKLILQEKHRKPWKKAKVFIFPSNDTLIVKKVQKPLSNLSDLSSRISSPRMSKREIEKEIQSFRKNK